MSKQISNLELAIQKLLKFMQYEIEQHYPNGIKDIKFDFTKTYVSDDKESKIITAGDDLSNLVKQGNISEELAHKAIKSAISRGFIERIPCPSIFYPSMRSKEENPNGNFYIKLTKDGYQESSLISPEISDKIIKEKKVYTKQDYSENMRNNALQNKKVQLTKMIRLKIIKPLFDKTEGKDVQERSNKLCGLLYEVFAKNDNNNQPLNKDQINQKIANFATIHKLSLNNLNEASDYFQEDKSGTIYNWCRNF